MLFDREDWTLFRNLPTLSQKAGVALDSIRRLVVKELVDNALDASGDAEVGVTDDGAYFVQDKGTGIVGTPEDIAELFSIRRPLTSSKLLRMPTRGAMGNGLRVVTGAVLATGGALTVYTNGRKHSLRPRDDGGTAVVSERAKGWARGTRIEVKLGDALPDDPHALKWGEEAIRVARIRGPVYKGKTSAWWYDADSFYELCQAAGDDVTVRELVEKLDGCTGGRAGEICHDLKGRTAKSVSREGAEILLGRVRDLSREVKPTRIGYVGNLEGAARAKVGGIIELASGRGGMPARVPFLIEAWARPKAGEDDVSILVNRTPVTGVVSTWRHQQAANIVISGCGLHHRFKVGKAPLSLTLNITTPHMPITTDGKEPDLKRFVGYVSEVVEAAARRARHIRWKTPGRERVTQRGVIEENLDRAAAMAGGADGLRFSQRQLFYALRPLAQESGVDLSWDWFCQVLTLVEEQRGRDVTGIYRDNRGTLYHPHEGMEMPVGTLAVEGYRRPRWTFNKILYCEKEGFFPILRHVKWPERHDCALLTSKGFASRAVRDLLDLLGDTDEELTFYCVHDADAYGTLIYQSLQQGTAARPGRRVKIVNLGLEPAEGLEMGLQAERVEVKKRKKDHPVAEYVPREWASWLQSNRIELNAMTSKQFLAWLDGKMAEHAGGAAKVIPPSAVLHDRLHGEIHDLLQDQITEKVLKEAGVEKMVGDAFGAIAPKLRSINGKLEKVVRRELGENPEKWWCHPVAELATQIVEKSKVGRAA